MLLSRFTITLAENFYIQSAEMSCAQCSTNRNVVFGTQDGQNILIQNNYSPIRA